MKKILAGTLIFTAFGFAALAQNAIHIQGADTLILLSQRWAQMYKLNHPQADIVIQGGGSSNALKALAVGRGNIVQLEGGSKPESGITFPVGVEGIAVYVNQSKPVNELTLHQLDAIFLGTITNWKQVGVPDRRILLFAGESSTGVLPYFQEVVLHDEEPYPFVGKASAKDLIDTVAQEPDAIGYSSIYPNTRVKTVRIKVSDSKPGIEATIENIRSRKYPISRYVYWHLASRPTADLRAFCEWVLSKDGQLVVESVGFEPLTPEDRASGLAKLH